MAKYPKKELDKIDSLSKLSEFLGVEEQPEKENLTIWSKIPEVIKESKDLITESVPTLEQHKQGWFRLMILWVCVVGGITLAVVFSQLNPQVILEHWLKNQKPSEECKVTEDAIICSP